MNINISGRFAGGRRVLLAWLLVACTGVSGAVHAQALEDSWRAATEGDLVTLQRLVERGTSPDTTDQEGHTLLMLAARGGHVPVASFLLARKASVNARSRYGDTALMTAALKGHVEVARLLLANGAELNPPGWTPLHYAAFEGRAAMVTFLLDKGADKNAIAPNEFTPLMLAVRNGHEEAARAILYGDPDVNYKTPSAGDTALKLAEKKGLAAVVALLKRAGATE